MLDKILRVSENKVVLFFTNRSNIVISTDDGTALELAISTFQKEIVVEDLEPTLVLRLSEPEYKKIGDL